MMASWADDSSKFRLVFVKLPMSPKGDRGKLGFAGSSSSLSSLYDFLDEDLLDFDGGG